MSERRHEKKRRKPSSEFVRRSKTSGEKENRAQERGTMGEEEKLEGVSSTNDSQAGS